MRRPLRLLLATLVALMLLGSALADGDATENVASPTFSALSNTTLTCSARLPATVVGCFIERPVLVLGALEVAVGVDAQAALTDAYRGHLAPYAVLAFYGETASAWIELRLPELAGLHPLGDPDYLRLGFSYRFD